MKCVLCDNRKAKRACPAKGQPICPLCCGEKRVLELDCPETCAFLKAGRERDSEEYAKLMRSQDPLLQEKHRRILSENQDVMAHLEYTIAQYRLVSRDLTDRDLRGAVDILLEAYRLEDKGILYEQEAGDLRVEPLRRELREVLESYRNPGGEGAKGTVDPRYTRLHLQSAIECLELLQAMIVLYSGNHHSGSSYVDFLARMIPRKESASSIIVP